MVKSVLVTLGMVSSFAPAELYPELSLEVPLYIHVDIVRGDPCQSHHDHSRPGSIWSAGKVPSWSRDDGGRYVCLSLPSTAHQVWSGPVHTQQVCIASKVTEKAVVRVRDLLVIVVYMYNMRVCINSNGKRS